MSKKKDKSNDACRVVETFNIKIEILESKKFIGYLVTSDDIPGLVLQCDNWKMIGEELAWAVPILMESNLNRKQDDEQL